MKIKSLILSVLTIFILPSCDEEGNALSTMDSEELNKEAEKETESDRSETRSFIGKNVLFIGNSQSISYKGILSPRVTTTTDSSIEIIKFFLPDGTSVSNGTVTTTILNSSVEDDESFEGQFNEIVDELGTYEYNLEDSTETAFMLSFDENNDKYVTNFIYQNDTSGTYEKTSDKTTNGVRSLTLETGTFEILD